MRTALQQDEDPPSGPLAELVALSQRRATLESELEQEQTVLVRRARTAGAPWAAIAAALGVSRQAVHKKYGGSRFSRG
ncbi:hypothetical protein [Brachybacterium hainanense]|uniref:Transcriptional regulator n=1 Tax=Brachybacterium hainanense TaxID=1541174 RepID=A0ABV6R8N3_9MICO